MRYSTEPRFVKYIEGYGFLSFARKFGDTYGKKLMDTATNTEIDATKTASKLVAQKTVEATEGFFFFSIRVFFTDTENLRNSMGREGTIFYSTLPPPLAYEH